MTHTKSTSIGALLNSGAKIAGSKDKKLFIKVAMCSRKQRCVWVAGFFRLQNDGGVKQSGWRWGVGSWHGSWNVAGFYFLVGVQMAVCWRASNSWLDYFSLSYRR
jgi:hypothetical protein